MSDDWLTVLHGDCRAVLPTLPAESVNCVVTSPPYFGLRDYGTATWDGGDPACDHRIGRVMGNANKGAVRDVLDGDRSRCKCGAVRQDSQIGLEATPEEYVATLVEVFRAVRRVLRNDGTAWLNLGDSYASHDPGGYRPGEFLNPDGVQYDKGSSGPAPRNRAGNYRPGGLKPKDLVGVPWLVARALQQPYYTGTIRDERDRIWLAAMLDAEGCLFIQKRKAGQHNGQGYFRTHDNYGPGVEIANTSRAVVERIMALVGKGSISTQGPDETGGRRKQTIYRWNLRTIECRDFVRELYPYLVAKQQQARILIGCPSNGERAEAAHAGLMALHRTGLSDVDFPAPASMFEPGWYLRSDVIWSKLNPMPESVTDRPTKSHEYLFLLAKQPRYWYDADAVREPHVREWDDRNGGNLRPGRDYSAEQGNPIGGGAAKRTAYPLPNPAGRNLRSVWTIATQPYAGAHFATFPPKLIEPCILAGCPEGGVVLDPFAGTGTAGLVANKLSRRAVLIDLNGEYIEQLQKRNAQTPLGLAG